MAQEIVLLIRSTVFLVLCQTICHVTSMQCGISMQCGYGKSTLGLMLRGHIFKRIMGVPLGHECLQACHLDVRCQSFNYVISQEMCELNDRTKEACPEDFVVDPERYYFGRYKERVFLGSIPELPAVSCKEIKASEGGQAVSGKYWFDSIIPGKTVLAHCDMESGDIDECSVDVRMCDLNANCVNTRGSYSCMCHAGFTGDGKYCTAVNCFDYPIGISSPGIIPDNEMTASSEYSSSYKAYYGRLNGARGDGWCSISPDSTNDWLQVDFAETVIVCAVATQGDIGGNEWTIDFKLSYSSDGNSWTPYKDSNGLEVEFHRKGDNNAIDQQRLPVLVSARYIRFHPTGRQKHNCLRVEVYSDKRT